MADVEMKKGDSSPILEYQLKDPDTGNPIDILGYNDVEFKMREEGKDTRKIDEGIAGNVVVLDAAKGKVSYEWAVDGSDTDEIGHFLADWTVTFDSGREETIPNGDNYLTIEIGERS